MDENLLKELKESYPHDERVLKLIEAYRSILYSEKKITEKICNIQKMEAIADMATGIAHDFNNILMGIQGNISLLLLKNNLHPSVVSQFDKINDLLDDGKQLTEQILSYAGGKTLDTVPVNLGDIVKATLNMYANTHKGIVIHENIENGSLTVKAVPGQVKQIFFNILINAGHAMSEAGDLYVDMCKTFLTENETTTIGLMPGKYIKTSITDTGMGMDDVTKRRIFEPYFTTRKSGTGLGLAIAYNIVKQHNGIITVYSERGRGTTFNIYIPEYNGTVIADRTKSEDSIIKGQGTVLAVDDEPANLDIISEYLAILGYTALKASGGRDAINMYSEFQKDIDLVILDMAMPGIGGLDVLERIKEINPEARVLMTSGWNGADRVQELTEKGCNCFVRKPYTLGLLSRKIHETFICKG